MTHPDGLPAPVSPLLGRDRDVRALAAAVCAPGARLVTLTGPGGVGKTRLALAVAAAVADAFPDGVGVVSLGAVRDPTLLAATMAQGLGLPPSSTVTPEAQLAAFVHDRALLLVLDNFEHIVDAAPLVADLLAFGPRLHVLVTSRVRLRLAGEQEHIVPPLGLSDPAAKPTVEQIGASGAVQLFVARAQAVNDAFALVEDNAAAVAIICARLDGLPLAIELAAARSKTLPPATLLARLERRLPLLTGGRRDAPARQQTMRAAIAWSYDLLPPSTQQLFRRLTVFVGGFRLDAAEAVAAVSDEDGVEVVDGLTALVDQSLVQPSAGPDAAPRFAMLETLREYGLEQLAASGEAAQIRDAHAAWALAVAEQADRLLQPGPDPALLERLEAEQANLRAALAWLIDTRATTAALRLATAFWPLGFYRGQATEGRRWLGRALALDGAADRARAEACVRAAWLALEQADPIPARRLAEDAVRTFQALGDRVGAAGAQWLLGDILCDLGERQPGMALQEDALATFRAVGERLWMTRALNDLGLEILWQGDLARAEALLTEVLALLRALGATSICITLGNVGLLARLRGDLAGAAALVGESLALALAQGHQRVLASDLEALAGIAAAGGDGALAARLFGAAEVLRERIAVPKPPGERDLYARDVAAARAMTDMATFTAAWAAGRTRSPEEIVRDVARIIGDRSPLAKPSAPEPDGPAYGLSPREREILRLLVAGRSNPEIAAALFISRRTVTTHLTHMFAKLGVTRREEAMALALRSGLVLA